MVLGIFQTRDDDRSRAPFIWGIWDHHGDNRLRIFPPGVKILILARDKHSPVVAVLAVDEYRSLPILGPARLVDRVNAVRPAQTVVYSCGFYVHDLAKCREGDRYKLGHPVFIDRDPDICVRIQRYLYAGYINTSHAYTCVCRYNIVYISVLCVHDDLLCVLLWLIT